VDLTSARLLLGGNMVELVDLPGVNDLTGYTDDEAVVRDVLMSTAFDAVVLLNAAQLDRQLPLAMQILASGLPAVLVLNMADEARLLGVNWMLMPCSSGWAFRGAGFGQAHGRAGRA
jgi:ferrous iron transport protein B